MVHGRRISMRYEYIRFVTSTVPQGYSLLTSINKLMTFCKFENNFVYYIIHHILCCS